MKQMFGEQVMDKGNISDFLLNTLNNLYGKNKTNEEDVNQAG